MPKYRIKTWLLISSFTLAPASLVAAISCTNTISPTNNGDNIKDLILKLSVLRTFDLQQSKTAAELQQFLTELNQKSQEQRLDTLLSALDSKTKTTVQELFSASDAKLIAINLNEAVTATSTSVTVTILVEVKGEQQSVELVLANLKVIPVDYARDFQLILNSISGLSFRNQLFSKFELLNLKPTVANLNKALTSFEALLKFLEAKDIEITNIKLTPQAEDIILSFELHYKADKTLNKTLEFKVILAENTRVVTPPEQPVSPEPVKPEQPADPVKPTPVQPQLTPIEQLTNLTLTLDANESSKYYPQLLVDTIKNIDQFKALAGKVITQSFQKFLDVAAKSNVSLVSIKRSNETTVDVTFNVDGQQVVVVLTGLNTKANIDTQKLQVLVKNTWSTDQTKVVGLDPQSFIAKTSGQISNLSTVLTSADYNKIIAVTDLLTIKNVTYSKLNETTVAVNITLDSAVKATLQITGFASKVELDRQAAQAKAKIDAIKKNLAALVLKADPVKTDLIDPDKFIKDSIAQLSYLTKILSDSEYKKITDLTSSLKISQVSYKKASAKSITVALTISDKSVVSFSVVDLPSTSEITTKVAQRKAKAEAELKVKQTQEAQLTLKRALDDLEITPSVLLAKVKTARLDSWINNATNLTTLKANVEGLEELEQRLSSNYKIVLKSAKGEKISDNEAQITLVLHIPSLSSEVSTLFKFVLEDPIKTSFDHVVSTFRSITEWEFRKSLTESALRLANTWPILFGYINPIDAIYKLDRSQVDISYTQLQRKQDNVNFQPIKLTITSKLNSKLTTNIFIDIKMPPDYITLLRHLMLLQLNNDFGIITSNGVPLIFPAYQGKPVLDIADETTKTFLKTELKGTTVTFVEPQVLNNDVTLKMTLSRGGWTIEYSKIAKYPR